MFHKTGASNACAELKCIVIKNATHPNAMRKSMSVMGLPATIFLQLVSIHIQQFAML